MTEKMLESFFPAILAFLLGLLAKFAYDIWDEKRKRKSLVFTKTVLTSFSLNQLEDNIRDKTQAIYEGYQIDSIQRVRVEVENNGSASVRNQAFTVRFDKNARILGEPISESSSEDLRYVYLQQVTGNSSRFILKLLQRERRLSWIFTVINHEQPDFAVEPGIAKGESDDEKTDVDVTTKVTNDKVELDLIGRIKRSLTLFTMAILLIITRNMFVSLLSGIYLSVSVIVGNSAIVIVSLVLLKNLLELVEPLLEWLKKTFGEKAAGWSITVGNISSSSGIAIGTESNASATISNDVSDLMDILSAARTQLENEENIFPTSEDPRNLLPLE